MREAADPSAVEAEPERDSDKEGRRLDCVIIRFAGDSGD